MQMLSAGLCLALALSLAACSGADLARTCEEIEPWRPVIRGVVTAVEPVAAIPFAFTRNVSCADAEAVAARLR